MKGQALPVTGDGTETRDWTFVEDAINGLLAMGVRHEAVGEAINLGSGKEHRVKDMARTVNGLTGNTSWIHHTQTRDWDAKPLLLSSIDNARKSDRK